MNIGIILGRIGGEDGVGLETEKWIEVMQKMGHEPYVLSGLFERDILPKKQQTVYPVLSFDSEECLYEQDKAFFNPDEDAEPLLNHLEKTSNKIQKKIAKWVKDKKLDVLISENASSLPFHFSMGMGIAKFVRSDAGRAIKVILHNHDWHWERGDRYVSPHMKVMRICVDNFPIIQDNVKHAVINEFGVETVKRRFNEDAVKVPNVMDFEKSYGEIDEYNKDMRADLGLVEDDIALFQVTRIVERKRIDTAVELIAKLNKLRRDRKIKLVITGSDRDDDKKGGVVFNLKELADKLGVSGQIIYAGDRFDAFRGQNSKGEKIYTVEDAHAIADGETYFSDYEGFGNAFVECVNAKKPIFVNNYKPVYMPDIGSKGFKTVMIENNKFTFWDVWKINRILNSQKLKKKIIDFNYELARREFSFLVLESKLRELLD